MPATLMDLQNRTTHTSKTSMRSLLGSLSRTAWFWGSAAVMRSKCKLVVARTDPEPCTTGSAVSSCNLTCTQHLLSWLSQAR